MAEKLRVRWTFTEEVLGSRPANKEFLKYITADAPEDKAKEEFENMEINEADDAEAPKAQITVFSKENGEPFVWDYTIKGLFKDSCGMLRKIPKSACHAIKAYKKAIDGLIFVSPRKIFFAPPEGQDKIEIGVCQRPLRAATMQGERVAVATSETVPAGSSIEFEIELIDELMEKMVIECMEYGRLHGFSQWRNSGKGSFTYEILAREQLDTLF
jgi:hypothetical protein